MKTIDTKTITENVKRLCIEAATFIKYNKKMYGK